MNIGERLKKLRKEKKLTQVQLGQLVNLSHSMITRYEKGEYQPDLNTINKLADIFNCTTDYLLGRTDKKDAAILEGDEVPKELRDVGISYMEVDKIAKEEGFTPEDIKEILQTVAKIKKEK